MRKKELQCVVTFRTTTEAMAFEEAAKEAGLGGRIIPLPRVIAAGCGLVWKDDPKNRELIEKLLEEKNIGYDMIHVVII